MNSSVAFLEEICIVCLQWLHGCFQCPYLRKIKLCRNRNGNDPFPNAGSNIKAIFFKNHKMLQASNEIPSCRLGGNLWCKQTWKCMKKNLWKRLLVFLPFPELWPETPCSIYSCNVRKHWAFIPIILENLEQNTYSDSLHKPQAIVSITLFQSRHCRLVGKLQ